MTAEEFAEAMVKLESFMGVPKNQEDAILRERQKSELYDALQEWNAVEFVEVVRRLQSKATYGKRFAPGDFFNERKQLREAKAIAATPSPSPSDRCPDCRGNMFVAVPGSEQKSSGRPLYTFCKCHPGYKDPNQKEA